MKIFAVKMKHDSATKPQPIAIHSPRATSQQPASKRGLWRNRSVSEARSPITKAFDFLPWPRNKKPAEKPTSQRTTSAPVAKPNEDKGKDVLNYHRNIFRSSGGIIRDILGDKLNKEKPAPINVGSPKKSNQRKLKQMVVRNKSLDINELINSVENDLTAHQKQNGRKRFLDDTFIENIIKAREDFQRKLAADDETWNENGEYFHDGIDECQLQTHPHKKVDEAHEMLRSSQHYSNTNGPASTKHILFNDENTVYLIKKELPVKQEMSKTIEHTKALRKLSPNSSSSSTNNKNAKERRLNEQECGGENILKARLKFKKLTPEAAPAGEHKTIPQKLNNSRVDPLSIDGGVGGGGNPSNYHSSKPITDNCVKRGILHNNKQRISPVNSCAALLTSPELHRRHNDYFRHNETEATHMQRRKSLTDTSYDNLIHEISSSSSTGSGGGCGIMSERPKTDKPRKKLSFREPVVSEKLRIRRRSSPMQRTAGLLNGNEKGNCGMDGNINAARDSNDFYSRQQDNRYMNANNVMATDKTGCVYNENADEESQAMRIVRTVGQAFEVCHKFNLHKNSLDHNDERSDVSSELLDTERISVRHLSDEDLIKKDQVPLESMKPPQRPNHLELVPQGNLNLRQSPQSPTALSDEDKSSTTPSSPSREILKLKDQLEQQALQTRQALAQLMLVREQLISETNARIEAQARTQQLLQQNRELLEHLASLGAYTEHQTAGLTSANIAMAPQGQLQMLLQATSNNNNLATINQQINNLGTINQQLTSLSHQLSGLNQQSQNLQNFQNVNTNLQQQTSQLPQQQQQHQTPSTQQQQQQLQTLTSTTPTPTLHHSQLHLNVSTANPNVSSSPVSTLASSPFPSINQLATISNQLQQINAQNTQQQHDALSKDLFQVNQELLNRLQALNLGVGANTNALAINGSTVQPPSPQSSFFYVNPMSCSPSNNNNSASNFNFLSSPSPLGNMTPSPMGTLSRNSYSNSPINLSEELQLSMDKHSNALDEHLIKPLSHLSSSASNGNLACSSGTRETSRSSSTVDTPSSPNMRSSNNNNNNNNNNNDSRFNQTVMLKITDEAGNVTNQRKLSATPSFITRSTSEKVPNRSQMMSQVQRTQWARHTTK